MRLRRLLPFFKAAAGGAPTYATWNPSDKSSSITLSGGNLTEKNNAAGNAAVRAGIGKASGKWYWENTIIIGTGIVLGVGNSSASLTTRVGFDANGWGYASATKWNNGASTSYGASFTAGDIISVALDMDGGTITFYKNGVSQGTAFTGLTGTLFPMSSSQTSGAGVTSNFGASALAYSPPAGFNAGLY